MTDNPEKEEKIDRERRRFLVAATATLGGIGAACALKPLISSLSPGIRTLAEAAPVEVDLSRLAPGQQLTLRWRGKPVWVIRRTPEMLQHLADNIDNLRDPFSLTPQQPAYAQNTWRSVNPEYLVLIGICTHLGCTPRYTGKTGFLCPCHGSSFDLAGRVFKEVPAPINLEVPPHHFLTPQRLIIGEDGT